MIRLIKNIGKLNIARLRQRLTALFMVFVMLLTVPVAPAEVQAADIAGSVAGAAIGALPAIIALFKGKAKQEELVIERNSESIEREKEAQRQKDLLKSNGEGNTARCRLSTAKTLAAALSEKIDGYDMKIDVKTAKMKSAVRALKERERTMKTIRWSPLFSIKWPEKAKETEAFEFQFKPIQLQNEITLIKHKITETELDIYEKVSNTYIKVIFAQKQMDALSTRHRKLENAVSKLEIKVKDGTAALEEGVTETDENGNEVAVSPRVLRARVKAAKERLEVAEKRLDACTEELANAITSLEENKAKLSNLMGFDVTENYTFEDAFVTANLNRDNIDYLYEYALKDDASVYEAQMANDEALLSLRLNYQLLKQQYPRDIGLIEPYVQQSLEGVKIAKRSFRKDYDEFLKRIDADWQGSYHIWFISIPKEWLKGQIDGIRYVENDPYVLYTAALDYESAAKDLKNAKSELRSSISSFYSNYASQRKAYMTANKEYLKAEKKLGLDEVNYLMGDLTQEEFENEESEYNDLKDSADESLADFSETLYSFDRATCGGLSKFLTGAATDDGNEAISLVPVIRRGCIYTIRPIIDTEEFLLTVDVPDDFYAETGINVTHFELYADGHKIGGKDDKGNDVKTPVGQNLRHLMLTTEDLNECSIKVYNGDTFIDECRIDPTVYSGPLNITVGYEEEDDGHTLGTFTTSDDVATNMMVLIINLDQEQVKKEYVSGKEAKYYRLCIAQDKFLLSDRMVPVGEEFTYLSLAKGDLDSVFIELLDEAGEKIGDALFDVKKGQVYHDVDEETAAKIAEQKRLEAIERAKQEEEDAANAEARAARETAKEILTAFGCATDEASIDYAVKHLNELAYSLELKQASESLRKEHEDDEEKYQRLQNDPNADPKELEAVANRLRITDKMPDIYDKSVSEGTIGELKDHAEKKVNELLAEYRSCKGTWDNYYNEQVKRNKARDRGKAIENELKSTYPAAEIDVTKWLDLKKTSQANAFPLYNNYLKAKYHAALNEEYWALNKKISRSNTTAEEKEKAEKRMAEIVKTLIDDGGSKPVATSE